MNKPLHVDRRNTLLAAQGQFELERYPRDANLQAWDAADELLLAQVADLDLLARDSRTLILNDAFGALAVALAGYPVFSWNDSWLAQRALADNLRANGYPADQVRVNSGVDLPAVAFDLVLIKVPKSLALLEHQLYGLRPLLHRGSVILGAAMSRHIHRSTLQGFESIIGPTTTSRARKKARLIYVERDHSLNEGRSPYPDSYQLVVDREYRIINHASLFSRDRLLLEHMPSAPNWRRIVDLGCGNGVLGIVAADRNPDARIEFRDESYMALASAEANFGAAFGGRRDAGFEVCDGLSGMDDADDGRARVQLRIRSRTRLPHQWSRLSSSLVLAGCSALSRDRKRLLLCQRRRRLNNKLVLKAGVGDRTIIEQHVFHGKAHKIQRQRRQFWVRHYPADMHCRVDIFHCRIQRHNEIVGRHIVSQVAQLRRVRVANREPLKRPRGSGR